MKESTRRQLEREQELSKELTDAFCNMIDENTQYSSGTVYTALLNTFVTVTLDLCERDDAKSVAESSLAVLHLCKQIIRTEMRKRGVEVDDL